MLTMTRSSGALINRVSIAACVSLGFLLAPRMSIPNVLQQPVRGDLVSDAFLLGRLIDPAGNGKKLQALKITALRIRDLFRRSPSFSLLAQQIGKKHRAV